MGIFKYRSKQELERLLEELQLKYQYELNEVLRYDQNKCEVELTYDTQTN